MKTDFDINEELERVEGKLAASMDQALELRTDLDDAAYDAACEEVSAELKGDVMDMTIRDWNEACKAVQARRAAA
jgi:hypothetical protein